MFTKLGRRLRAFSADVWGFVAGDLFDISEKVGKFLISGPWDTWARDFYNTINPLAQGGALLNKAIEQIAKSPEQTVAAAVAVAVVPTPWTDLVVATLMRAPLEIALEFSLADEKAAVDLAITLQQLPTLTEAQVMASLPFIAAQTEAGWQATKPLLPDQARAGYDAERPLLPEQAVDKLEAEAPTFEPAARLKYDAEKGLLPEQAVDGWEADKPLAGEQAEVKSQADLDAAQSVRPENIPSGPLINAFFRQIISDPEFRAILKRSGIPDDQIEAFVEGSKFFPTRQDLTFWTGREVFEKDSVERYGLADEFGNVDISLFALAGVSEDFALNDWMAHWSHPSFGQLATMLHRDILFDVSKRDSVKPLSDEWRALRAEETKEAEDWLKLVEIPPYARAPLIASIFRPPSRVDVRRMWGLGVIDDDDVLRATLDAGKSERDAEQYLLFVKVFNLVPAAIAALTKGWRTEESVLQELRDLGLNEEVVQRIFQSKVKAPSRLEKTVKERDLTKGEIVKGVKKEVLTRDEGQELLEEMGYDPSEAAFILTINVGVLAGSPETFPEFLDWVRKGRRADGQECDQVPPVLVELGEQIHKLREEVGLLDSAAENDERRRELEGQVRQLQRRQDALAAQAGCAPRGKAGVA